MTISKPGNASQFLGRLFFKVLPLARREIQRWTEYAARIPDPVLREQALASIQTKRFHADGGCVYAAVNPLYTASLVRLIVAFQTISDYLDNLCDRCDTYDMEDFHQLHHAMRDAVDPTQPLRDYYALRQHADDGGYLRELVLNCRREVDCLPGYAQVMNHVQWFVERYCELQEYKHIEPTMRTPKLESWWSTFSSKYPDLDWWEFAAAAGSTLAVFALFLLATNPHVGRDAEKICEGYFPWVCGLHILLDYLIDMEEDSREGDFNFVQCYASPDHAHQRIRHFAHNSLRLTKGLSSLGGQIHRFVVQGLLGMYLSDRKVAVQRHVRSFRKLVWEFGPTTWMFYGACVLYRVVR